MTARLDVNRVSHDWYLEPFQRKKAPALLLRKHGDEVLCVLASHFSLLFFQFQHLWEIIQRNLGADTIADSRFK